LAAAAAAAIAFTYFGIIKQPASLGVPFILRSCMGAIHFRNPGFIDAPNSFTVDFTPCREILATKQEQGISIFLYLYL
jgi:hypothetical protein